MNLFKKTSRFLAALLLLSLFACTTTEATRTSDAASAIADFEPPAGYSPELSTSISGYTLVAYKGPDGPSHLYLIQSEKESDGEELTRMLTQLVPRVGDPGTGITVTENLPATIRGQEVTLIIGEGVNAENVPYRQITAAFDGKGGPALLIFSDSVETWDQAAVDAFLASIR